MDNKELLGQPDITPIPGNLPVFSSHSRNSTLNFSLSRGPVVLFISLLKI